MTPSRPVALWVSPVGDIGGVGRHLLDVARVGMRAHRLIFVLPPGPAAAALRACGAAVVTADVGPSAGAFRAARLLQAIVDRVRPSVVHSHLAWADVLTASLRLPRTSARISTEHGIAGADGLYHTNRAVAVARRRMHAARLRRFDGAIAVCRSTRAEMIRQWRARLPITVILNGVSASASPHHTPGRRLLSLSRLSHEKGIPTLLRTMPLLPDDVTLTVAGDGPLRDELIAEAHALGVSDRVDFPGFVDAAEANASHDVLIQLSEWENCSYSLLDAVASGMGVVATDVGGNAEILPPRCLVAPDPPDIAARVLEQADDLDLRPGLRPEWPTTSRMVDAIEKFYAEVRT